MASSSDCEAAGGPVAIGIAVGNVVVVRVQGWSLAVRLEAVRWVHQATMPVLEPTIGGARAYFAVAGRTPLPLVFAAHLLASREILLRASDSILELDDGGPDTTPFGLWVSAVDDVLEQPTITPVQGTDGSSFVQGTTGAIPVLDLPRLHRAVRACFSEETR